MNYYRLAPYLQHTSACAKSAKIDVSDVPGSMRDDIYDELHSKRESAACTCGLDKIIEELKADDTEVEQAGEKIYAIVTFTCQKTIIVYHVSAPERPRYPYRTHKSVESAKRFMSTQRGIKNAEVIHKRY